MLQQVLILHYLLLIARHLPLHLTHITLVQTLLLLMDTCIYLAAQKCSGDHCWLIQQQQRKHGLLHILQMSTALQQRQIPLGLTLQLQQRIAQSLQLLQVPRQTY